MKKLRTYLTKANLLLMTLLLCSSSLLAQKEKPLTRVLFIFDASQSMYTNWEDGSRMDIAKVLLSNMLDSLRGKEFVANCVYMDINFLYPHKNVLTLA